MALSEDTRHLLDLLSMLPEPTDEAWPALWDLMQKGAQADTVGPFFRDCIAQYLELVLSKPEDDPGRRETVHNLAAHVLMCLDVDDDAKQRLVPVLAHVVGWRNAHQNASGQRWLDDILDTAWRVLVASVGAQTPEERRKEYEVRRGFILDHRAELE